MASKHGIADISSSAVMAGSRAFKSCVAVLQSKLVWKLSSLTNWVTLVMACKRTSGQASCPKHAAILQQTCRPQRYS